MCSLQLCVPYEYWHINWDWKGMKQRKGTSEEKNSKTSNLQEIYNMSGNIFVAPAGMVRYRRPVFCSCVRPSTVMSTLAISSTIFLINYTFHAPLTSTNFTSTLAISSTIDARTVKPCIMFLLDLPIHHAPWPGDLDLYFTLQWLWQI